MFDKPKIKDREVENASPQQIREALEEYVQHMLGHDPDTLEFALMITGHGKANGGTHVCSMISGPPQTIAYIITELMSELINRDPDVEAQIKNLISKLQGGTPPSGSIH